MLPAHLTAAPIAPPTAGNSTGHPSVQDSDVISQVPLPTAGQSWPRPPLVTASMGLHGLAAAAALAVPGAAPWALGSIVLNHALLTGLGLWPRSQGLGPNVTRLPASTLTAGSVALTLDDGPDAEVTPAVLDVLAAHGAHATFFCIAQRVVAQPSLAALLRRIVAAGHNVQNHSATHRHDFSLLGPRGLEREISRAQQILADATGEVPHCFRAPAGLRSPLLDPVLHRMGLNLVSWTRRGFDTRQRQPEAVLQRLTKGLAGGDILLMHDGHAAHDALGRPVVLQVLPQLLDRLATDGLTTVTLREALPTRHTRTAP